MPVLHQISRGLGACSYKPPRLKNRYLTSAAIARMSTMTKRMPNIPMPHVIPPIIMSFIMSFAIAVPHVSSFCRFEFRRSDRPGPRWDDAHLHLRIDRRDDDEREDGRRDHPSHHRDGDALHHLGARARAPEDWQEAGHDGCHRHHLGPHALHSTFHDGGVKVSRRNRAILLPAPTDHRCEGVVE